MAKSDVRAGAAAVASRLTGEDGIAVPDALTPHFIAFSQAQADYEAAAAATDAAEERRDAALDAIGEADDLLDAQIDVYAVAIVAAQIGTRMQPFKGFSKHSPSELKELAYANEVVAVRALVGAAVATKPDPAVVAAGDVLLARAGVLDAALVGLTVPQAEYERALHARDLLLPGLRKALKTFKTHAASVWIADRPTYDAVFAAPPPIQRPRRRRAPKKAAPSPATAPAIA